MLKREAPTNHVTPAEEGVVYALIGTAVGVLIVAAILGAMLLAGAFEPEARAPAIKANVTEPVTTRDTLTVQDGEPLYLNSMFWSTPPHLTVSYVTFSDDQTWVNGALVVDGLDVAKELRALKTRCK